MHYREHVRHLSTSDRATHYLVIGPWDHFGTRTPTADFCGVKAGPASLVDLQKLQVEWYRWTLNGGTKPAFLQKNVAYYVMGAHRWRYASSLEEVTAHVQPMFLASSLNPTDVFRSGSLVAEPPASSRIDHYTYDSRDVANAELESTVDPENRADQRMVHAAIGKQLVYHSEPFEQDTEISGFFALSVWISIDQPDTDFCASVYEIDLDGRGVLLTNDCLRARYRGGLREEKLIETREPLRYDFRGFTFISRRIAKGSRLRLVVGPINSIFSQKNYNTGGIVAEESVEHARVVRVDLLHDQSHPSALYVPYGQPED
jgi:putative CocE/NonD family hydrolase